MSYHNFLTDDGEPFGSFEIFYLDTDGELDAGWYWQACFPGCLPDGDAMGPFDSHAAALDNARS